jgi:creatinine amidohydrolase
MPSMDLRAKPYVEMTSEQVKQALADTDAILISVSQLVQHGPHLPINTDLLEVSETARRIVALVNRLKLRLVQGPLIPFGHSPYHRDFPGYVSLEPETLARVVRDVGISLANQGFKKQVYLNLGGAQGPLETGTYWVREATSIRLHVLNWFEVVAGIESKTAARGEYDGHGGERETACVLAIAPDLVAMDRRFAYESPLHKMSKQLPFVRFGMATNMTDRHRALSIWSIKDITPHGHYGDPTVATSDEGGRILDTAARVFAEFIETQVLGQGIVTPLR